MLANLPSTYTEEELEALREAEEAEERARFQLKIKELSDARFRPIGSVAYRNGEKVLWAGQDWDYQTPGSFNELIDKGKIKIEEKYHGEIATDNVLKTLSGAAQNYSDLMSQNEYGRNHLANLSNLAKGASDVYDYLIDESERKGDPTTTGEWGALVLGSILKDREKYAKKVVNGLSQLKIGDKGIDPRLLQIATEEGMDALLTLGIGGISRSVVKTATNLKLPPGRGLVPAPVDGSFSISRAGDELVSPNMLKMSGKLTGSQINAAITPEGVLNRYGVYRKNRITGKKERVPLPDESALPTLGRKDQHHWIPKDTRHAFTQQANKLDPKGQAALDAIDVEYGLQAGGGEKGVTTMDMGAHLPLHGRIRSAGYELSGTQLKAFKKEIAGIKDIEQLKVVYRDWLEKNVIPTLSTVEALQGGYELLEAGGKPITKEALLNAAYGRGGWMDRQLSVVENRIDAAIQAGRTPRRADILFKARAEQDALNNLF